MRDRDGETRRRVRFRPSLAGLEGRLLLSQVPSQVALVKHEYDGFVGELKSLELGSHATSAEYLALRDDARSISLAASSTALPPTASRQTAVAVSLQLDLSPLEGWLGDKGWAQVQATLDGNLASLGAPQSLADKTFADMRAVAASAGVTATEYASYSSDFNRLRDGEGGLQGGFTHYADPSVYYTQHLRGFFPGGIADKRAAQAQLNVDIASVASGPGGSSVLHRDANLLESIGAGLPSATNDQLGDAYATSFAVGSPSTSTLAQLGSQIGTILGKPGSSPSGPVARLIQDAPTFYRAAGSNEANIVQIIRDVRTVVDAGGDSRLNPFVVQVAP